MLGQASYHLTLYHLDIRKPHLPVSPSSDMDVLKWCEAKGASLSAL